MNVLHEVNLSAPNLPLSLPKAHLMTMRAEQLPPLGTLSLNKAIVGMLDPQAHKSEQDQCQTLEPLVKMV